MGEFVDKSKIKLKELSPYFLHFGIVVMVALYVIGGALTIREIEKMKKIRNFPGNGTETSPSVRLKRGEHQMRRQSMNRTRRCVLAAIHRIAIHTNCSKEKMRDGWGLDFLDQCYKYDLQRIAHQANTKHRHENAHSDVSAPSNHNREFSLRTSDGSEESEEDEYEYWTFMDCVLFCFTVITTIGYGNVAPKTLGGRLFVIGYGLFGVPCTMLAIANLGKFLASLLKAWTKPFIDFGRRCRRRFRRTDYTMKEKQRLMDNNHNKKGISIISFEFLKKKRSQKEVNPADSDSEDELEQLEEEDPDASTDAVVLFVAFLIYIVVGSFIIAAYEPQMDFFMAIYFNFVTLTTIGLGDLVPQSETYLIFTLLYCAVGLALTTIAIEIAADYLKKLHYFGRKLDNVGNVKIWFGGKQLTMKQLVRNLGDQFNVDVDELQHLNLETFVDNAIKVEAGELATLRAQEKPYMNTAYWRALDGTSLVYVDEDPQTFTDLLTMDSNRNYSTELL